MSITPIDQAVRDEIEHNLDMNLCVEASAGTGKTTVLVARIVQILRSGRATVDKLAVITFTEKAAAELSARVRESLESALLDATDEAQITRISSALRNLNRARIETIHAFASNLLRERPVEAGLDPNFEVLDDLGSSIGFEEAYRRWLSDVLSQPSKPLWRAFNRGFELRHLRETAELLHQHRAQLPLTLDEPAVRSAPTMLTELQVDVDRLSELLENDCKDRSDKGAIQIESILERFEEYRQWADRSEVLERVMLKPLKITSAGNKTKWQSGAGDEQKSICQHLKQELESYQEALRNDALVGILPLVEAFVQEYSEQRLRNGTAEFDDLLIWTRDLLRDQPDVRRYFQQRFDCVLVDEFQDTDPLQVEIVLYLTGDDPGEKDWRTVRPLPGKLFVVGDPKQSIYRFRRADITIYEWVKHRVLQDGLRSIQQNFRSVDGVITWVNDVFSRIIEPLEGIQPNYGELVAARPNHIGWSRPVLLARGTAKGAEAMRAEEARLLAGMIERIVKDECWPVEEANEIRPASWRDVAILLPTRTGIGYYEQALAERNIPYRHEGGRSFFERQEVQELVSCLKAIDDPTDRVSLVAALRSGAFGCSDDELFQFVNERGSLDIRVEPKDGVPAVTEALAVLRGLSEVRGLISLPEFVGQVLEETRLVEYAITLPQGQQAAANLLKVADQARAFSGVHGGGLRAFVRWLTTSSGGHGDEADAAVAEARDDVVRILTIHAAKGLEFPIVALANLNTGGRPTTAGALPDQNAGRLELCVGTSQLNFKTPGFDEANEREALHEEAERRRLLYVAATRARDYLILPAVLDGDKAKGMLEALSSCLPLSPDGATPVHLSDSLRVYDTSLISDDPIPAPDPDPVTANDVDEQEQRRAEWLEQRATLIEHAAQGLPLTILDGDGLWDGSEMDEEEIARQRIPDEDQARDWAFHRVMSRVDLDSPRNLASLCRRIAETAQLPDGAEELLALARNCLESPVIGRATASDSVQRDVVFSVPLPDGGFIEGRVDLLFSEGSELVAVDFNTEIELPEVDREYAATLGYALESATRLNVKEIVQVFAGCGEERSVPVTDDLRAVGNQPPAKAQSRP